MAEETTETVEVNDENTGLEEHGVEQEQEDGQEPVDPAAGLKSALQKERASNKDAAKRIRDLERELADRDRTPDEQALEDARREAAAEATSRANRKLVAAEFRSAAAKRVKDPRIASKLVDLEQVEVDDDGNVSADDLTAVLDALLEEYPDLAPSRFEGSADQGARGRGKAPSQLSRDDLKNMTPQAIIAAEKAGQLDRLKGKTI